MEYVLGAHDRSGEQMAAKWEATYGPVGQWRRLSQARCGISGRGTSTTRFGDLHA